MWQHLTASTLELKVFLFLVYFCTKIYPVITHNLVTALSGTVWPNLKCIHWQFLAVNRGKKVDTYLVDSHHGGHCEKLVKKL